MSEKIPEPGGYQREAGLAFGVGTLRHPCERFEQGPLLGHSPSDRCTRCDFPRQAHEPVEFQGHWSLGCTLKTL